MRTLYVMASTLNVRAEPSAGAKVVTKLERGAEVVAVGEEADGWLNVRIGDGRLGWVASRFVSEEKAEAPRRRTAAPKKRSGCESDYSFARTPTVNMAPREMHGLVVVDASVNDKGVVTSTKVVTNNTGDPEAARIAEREIRSARFAPPMRNCVARSFIFTYRRTF